MWGYHHTLRNHKQEAYTARQDTRIPRTALACLLLTQCSSAAAVTCTDFTQLRTAPESISHVHISCRLTCCRRPPLISLWPCCAASAGSLPEACLSPAPPTQPAASSSSTTLFSIQHLRKDTAIPLASATTRLVRPSPSARN
jgi:hypothetical protein